MSLVFRSQPGVIRMALARRAPDATPAVSAPRETAMARLARLHESGLLSDAEYAAARESAERRIPPG